MSLWRRENKALSLLKSIQKFFNGLFLLDNIHCKGQKTMLGVYFSVKPLSKKLLEIQEDTN